MTRIIIIGLTFLFATTLPASAEFYRYTDRHGNVIFTDDLSKVPPDQREKVKSYRESKYRPVEVEKPKDEQPAADKSKGSEEYNRLKKQEGSLDKERDALKSERSRLNQVKQEAVTPEQIKEYNRSIVDFNARVQAWEEKRDAFANEVKKMEDEKAADQQSKQKKQ